MSDNHRKITLYRDLDFVVEIFIVFLLDPNLTKEQMPHCINGLRASVFKYHSKFDLVFLISNSVHFL